MKIVTNKKILLQYFDGNYDAVVSSYQIKDKKAKFYLKCFLSNLKDNVGFINVMSEKKNE
jgi:hypothetical protein